ncbi:MAG: hypothetical protein JSR80_03240 [Verrucomicrobia bacterium]|nr:hypothetical protein [Verrucomicrobiota bacterium]
MKCSVVPKLQMLCQFFPLLFELRRTSFCVEIKREFNVPLRRPDLFAFLNKIMLFNQRDTLIAKKNLLSLSASEVEDEQLGEKKERRVKWFS